MIRIDGYYLYRTGTEIHPLLTIRAGQKADEVRYTLFAAETALVNLLQTPLNLKNSAAPIRKLLQTVQEVSAKLTASSATVNILDTTLLQSHLNSFEAVLNSELSVSDFYVVSKKGGFDITDLIFNASAFFPYELSSKVPQAVGDIQQATKCLAFELPTACAFHLMRATEAVLRVYWDNVSSGLPRPSSNNMGVYLNELNTRGLGNKAVTSALRDLKDLHRNPLIHPDHELEGLDDAIALFGQVRSVVTGMLKGIPSHPAGLLPAPSADEHPLSGVVPQP